MSDWTMAPDECAELRERVERLQVVAEAAERVTELLYNGVGWHDPPGAQEPGGKQGSCLDPEDSIALEKASDELLAALNALNAGSVERDQEPDTG